MREKDLIKVCAIPGLSISETVDVQMPRASDENFRREIVKVLSCEFPGVDKLEDNQWFHAKDTWNSRISLVERIAEHCTLEVDRGVIWPMSRHLSGDDNFHDERPFTTIDLVRKDETFFAICKMVRALLAGGTIGFENLSRSLIGIFRCIRSNNPMPDLKLYSAAIQGRFEKHVRMFPAVKHLGEKWTDIVHYSYDFHDYPLIQAYCFCGFRACLVTQKETGKELAYCPHCTCNILGAFSSCTDTALRDFFDEAMGRVDRFSFMYINGGICRSPQGWRGSLDWIPVDEVFERMRRFFICYFRVMNY